MAELIRDHAFEDELLAAVIADQNERPRTKQTQVGPSQVGGCRELLRASFFEDPAENAPDPYWHTAAHVGTVMGADLERIFGEKLDALLQQRVTVHLQDLGLSVSGAIDLIFMDKGRNIVADLKGSGAFGSVEYRDGVKLDYYIQISLYIWGLVQAGIMPEGTEGRIVYFDRVGNEQHFIAVVVTWEAVLNYVELAQRRLQDVVNAQAALEQGIPQPMHALRDHVPSFCFSTKVMCPRRLHCWGGSDWAPLEVIEDDAIRQAGITYVAGRRLENKGKAMKADARGLLEGINAQIVDGPMVSWTKRGISVVETTPLAQIAQVTKQAEDEAEAEYERQRAQLEADAAATAEIVADSDGLNQGAEIMDSVAGSVTRLRKLQADVEAERKSKVMFRDSETGKVEVQE